MKKLIAAVLAALIVVVQSPAVYAQTAPTPPSAPTPPPEPEYEGEAPEAPEAPTAPTPPPEPTPPPNPYDEENSDSSEPTPTPEPVAEASGDSSGGSTDTNQDAGSTSSGDSSSTGQTADGYVGDPEIDTGDATAVGTIVNDVNNNLASGGIGSVSVVNDDGGVSVINNENGSGSDNTGSATIVDNNTSIQDNDANVANNLELDSTTGDNSASKNVGSSSIDTGDANTSGTLVNTVNTNIDGVAVSEFNVADDHVGDIVLDFAANCISGCGIFDALAANTGNGTESTNIAEIDSEANNVSFQNNDATVENDMTLASDSGNNNTDNNTGGDSEISTGDANVAASVLNFANNNLEGAVIYAVVNIFGNLVGDIIFPDGTTCCIGSATAKNTGNGSDSTNTADINQIVNNEDYQFNEANIENNLVFDATTGSNSTADNTNGSSSIETGNANIDGQVVNIANTNISGGSWYLVLVNEAGRWLGKILGADGNYYAGSEGLEFLVADSGEITVVNSGNGSGSTNSGTVNSEVNNTNVQTNTANITNNLNLSANTGGNSASRNTGGDSSIETGDANIIANIVNFVNNNIIGGGTLYVTVVNVFGSWIGDFVGPGYEKENDDYADAGNNSGIGGTSGGSNSSGGSSSSGGGGDAGAASSGPSTTQPTPSPEFAVGSLIASATIEGGGIDFDGDDAVGFAIGGDGTETAGKQTVNINLAWLIVLVPLYFGFAIARRRKALRLLPSKKGK